MSLAEREANVQAPPLSDEQLKELENQIENIRAYLASAPPESLGVDEPSGFWDGYSSIWDLNPELPELDSIPQARSDFEEIRSDWNAVGIDLYNALLEFLQDISHVARRDRGIQ